MADIDIRNLRIGDALKTHGYINDDAIDEALEFQKSNREMRLGEILISLGYITEEVLLDFLSKLLKLKIVDLKQFLVDIEAVAIIPRGIAEKYNILLVSKTDTDAILAVNDPLNYHVLEEVRSFISENIQLVLCFTEDIEKAIAYNYSELGAKSAANDVKSTATFTHELDFVLQGDDDDETPVVKLVNSLLLKGYSVGATDIHIEPYENEVLVRLRVDGIITEYLNLEYNVYSSLIARIKIISGVDIAEKRMPQDGNFKYRLGDISFNIRTSVIPTVFGEKVVMRFLDQKAQITNMAHFGMNESDYQKALRILRNPHGIVYISGATGSGKTTTLYFFLEYMTKMNVSIVSIEDPVERKVRKVAQMQVNPAAGLTFQSGLRAILRQDPDIIMVGETRDEETASISVRSAITGHLVLSTIHTNSAISTISRLIDMGIPPYMVSGSIVGLISQRLVRTICPLCKKKYVPEQTELELIKAKADFLYKGIGCKDCNHSGYKGRISVHEIVEIDAKIRRMITERTDIDEIQKYCVEEKGMITIAEGIRLLILDGVTTTAEFIRVAAVYD